MAQGSSLLNLDMRIGHEKIETFPSAQPPGAVKTHRDTQTHTPSVWANCFAPDCIVALPRGMIALENERCILMPQKSDSSLGLIGTCFMLYQKRAHTQSSSFWPVLPGWLLWQNAEWLPKADVGAAAVYLSKGKFFHVIWNCLRSAVGLLQQWTI